VGGSSTSLDGVLQLSLAGDRSQAAVGNLGSQAICERVVALQLEKTSGALIIRAPALSVAFLFISRFRRIGDLLCCTLMRRLHEELRRRRRRELCSSLKISVYILITHEAQLLIS